MKRDAAEEETSRSKRATLVDATQGEPVLEIAIFSQISSAGWDNE